MKMQVAAAERQEAEALAALKDAEEREARHLAKHAAEEARMNAEIAEEDRKKKELQEKLQREKEANQKLLADMAAKQEADQAAAHAAAELAHRQAIAAREAQGKRQQALHEELLAARTNKMQAQYDHLWISGDPGILVASVVIDDEKDIDLLKTHLFFYNVVADMWMHNTGGLFKTVVTPEHKMFKNDAEHRVYFVTTTPRAEELIAVCKQMLGKDDIDLVMTTPKTGNRYYIEWVKEQTQMPGQAEVPIDQFGV